MTPKESTRRQQCQRRPARGGNLLGVTPSARRPRRGWPASVRQLHCHEKSAAALNPFRHAWFRAEFRKREQGQRAVECFWWRIRVGPPASVAGLRALEKI